MPTPPAPPSPARRAYITLLPKSITTAIGKGLSQELGGYPAVTMASIMVTGLFCAVAAPALLPQVPQNLP